MPRASTLRSFHSSSLIRVLSDLTLLDAYESEISFAEKLGLWLNLDDAIALHAVHASSLTTPLLRSATAETKPLDAEFAHLRASLAKLALPGGPTQRASSPSDRLSTQSEASNDPVVSYEPYRRHYLAHQRTMDSGIHTFRIKVREVLARTSPTLAKLAALDAVFDHSLGDRERKLLSRVPSLLETRFKQLRQAHEQAPIAAQEAGSSAYCSHPMSWLSRFCQELQTVLLAELDVRLEPTLGLIEAFNLELTQCP